jgi:hypothetical protein
MERWENWAPKPLIVSRKRRAHVNLVADSTAGCYIWRAGEARQVSISWKDEWTRAARIQWPLIIVFCHGHVPCVAMASGRPAKRKQKQIDFFARIRASFWAAVARSIGHVDGDRHRPLTIMRIPTVIAGNQGSMAHDAVWRSRRNRLRLRDPSRGHTGSADLQSPRSTSVKTSVGSGYCAPETAMDPWLLHMKMKPSVVADCLKKNET